MFGIWCLATEVNVARSRLKGALQEIEGNQNDDDDDASKPSRGRPPKRVKKELSPQPQQTVHHTFIMKLFDRSVDLGKYTPDTALYPICRAWMLNQPRSNLIVRYGKKFHCEKKHTQQNSFICLQLQNKKGTTGCEA